ncbi:MAG: glycosyl transferase [Alteromonas sp.]|nr:MAG: glycosyl transferase [Alteromonas sp.]
MNPTPPLISIVIPVYNAERFIEKAIESICNQSYKNIEIIVIDDGSIDESLQIIKSIRDDRIKIISRENRGLIASLNEGINLSRGSYIARMDADDISSPIRIEQQVKYFEHHIDCGVLFTGLEYIDENGNIIRKKVSDKTREIEPVEFLFGCPLCHPTAMFNMNKLTKDDLIYDPKFDKVEDFELWTRLSKTTGISLLNEVLFQYRIHSESITSKNRKNQRESAVEAIYKNLCDVKNKKIKNKLRLIYNNHQDQGGIFKTGWVLILLFVKLKGINIKFSRFVYAQKSYGILKRKLKLSPVKSLRSDLNSSSSK